MFPTSHDIYPGNLGACLDQLRKMVEAGNRVLIVTKPHLACVKRICKELDAYRDQILFRFTIGSADDAILRTWEPGAPRFNARLAALKWAYSAGFKTSVSCEPMLDGDIHAVIAAVEPYVTHSIWLGTANRLRQHIALTSPGNAALRTAADDLIKIMTDDHIRALYQRYEGHPLVRWKDSCKVKIGLQRPLKRGLDV